ncbi:MAG: sulfonate ABC transporter substrate-binding protein [Burkholderiales bacterium]|nr:sulfonate ABC transporter substrate-binding protein [Burkholderiales bacterium]
MTLIRSSRRRLLGQAAGLAAAVAAAPARAAYDAKQFRIGFQKSASLLTLLKAQGSIEKRLASQGIDVRWIEFPAGPQLLEGLNVGSIDFGYVGEAPPIFAQAAGASFVYVGYERAAPGAEAVLVPKESPIRSVADLRGKKIALNKGSNVHYLLVKLLEKEGLKYADVQPVFLPPADARAAFERGSVDAWVIWDPFQAAAEKQIGARLLADGKGVVSNHAFFLAEKEYATRRPDVIGWVLEAAQAQGRWIAQNHVEAARQVAPIQGLPVEVVELSLRRYSHDVRPIDDAVLVEQQKIADTFFDLKLIPKPIRVIEARLVASR